MTNIHIFKGSLNPVNHVTKQPMFIESKFPMTPGYVEIKCSPPALFANSDMQAEKRINARGHIERLIPRNLEAQFSISQQTNIRRRIDTLIY